MRPRSICFFSRAAAVLGDSGSRRQMGFMVSSVVVVCDAFCRSSASARLPAAMGFITPTLAFRFLSTDASPAVKAVLPISVSVPVMKMLFKVVGFLFYVNDVFAGRSIQ